MHYILDVMLVLEARLSLFLKVLGGVLVFFSAFLLRSKPRRLHIFSAHGPQEDLDRFLEGRYIF